MTGAILAGGRSRRMGFNKAFIRLPDGRAIIERTVEIFSSVFERTIIVANDAVAYKGLGVPVMADRHGGAGSIDGVSTALFNAGPEGVFVAACDMPRLDASVIRAILSHSGDLDADGRPFDAVVPFLEGRFHPMHAFYGKSALSTMEEMIGAGELRLTDLLERLRVRRLAEADFEGLPAAASVMNVNTPEDLERSGASVPGEKKK